MATLRSPTPRFGAPSPFVGPPPFGGPRYGGPGHVFMPRGPPGTGYGGERLGFNFRPSMPGQGASTYDGKKLRTKPLIRRTVDYSSSVTNYVKNRVWEKDHRDSAAIQPDALYATHLVPPGAMPSHPMNSVCTKYVRNASNKIKCPIFCVVWTPEGRRLITGASSGEFTLWNGLTFNFETILQAHDSSVRAMVWSHTGQWMVTGDHGGFIKYWQHNMNNVKMYQAHKDPIRGISFCPTDTKYASCSDDGTVRVWDFMRCDEERILRGHGADVKCVDWHPQKGLLVSGSRDTQQPIIMWDPRMGTKLSTIHAHKSTVMEVTFNKNGNWLLSASRDHLIKLFDVRKMKEELQSFKGHKKEAMTVSWNPVHESLFASGGSDGQIIYWLVGQDREVGCINEAHETMVWSLAWHPLGHILVSGSNDHSSKFWTRNRPGDGMRDRYNLNLLPQGVTDDMLEYDDLCLGVSIPGMGLEYMPTSTGIVASAGDERPGEREANSGGAGKSEAAIPGLDFSVTASNSQPDDEANRMLQESKKTPFAKPVPRDFERAWKEGRQPDAISAQNADQPEDPTARPPHPGADRGEGEQFGGRKRVLLPHAAPPPPNPPYQEEFMLPGMGGPLPGPDHEPTLPPSQQRRFADGPITSSGPLLPDHRLPPGPRTGPPPGGLLGDRPGDAPRFPPAHQPPPSARGGYNQSAPPPRPPHGYPPPPTSQQRSWSADADPSGGGGWIGEERSAGGRALMSTPGGRGGYNGSGGGGEFGTSSNKRRSYDDSHNSSQEDVFYDAHSVDESSDGEEGERGYGGYGSRSESYRSTSSVGGPPPETHYNAVSNQRGRGPLLPSHPPPPRSQQGSYSNNHSDAMGPPPQEEDNREDAYDAYAQQQRGPLLGNEPSRGRGGGRGGFEPRSRGFQPRGRGGDRGRGGGDRGRGGGDRGRGYGDRGRGERGGVDWGRGRGRGGASASPSYNSSAPESKPPMKRTYEEGPGGMEPQGNGNRHYSQGEPPRGRGAGRGGYGRGTPRGRGAPRGMART